MSQQIDKKAFKYSSIQTALIQKQFHVEKISGMLAVQCSTEFSSIKVWQRNDLHGCKTEIIFHRLNNIHSPGWVEGATQYR